MMVQKGKYSMIKHLTCSHIGHGNYKKTVNSFQMIEVWICK